MKTDQKKILIATGIYPPDIGGPATIISFLANSLRERGFVVKVLTYSKIPSIEQEKEVYRIIKNRLFSRLVYFLMMFKLSLSANLVYVTDTYSVGYFAYLIKVLIGKKYIVRFAGDSAWETATANSWTNDYIVDFQKNTYNQKIERIKKRRKIILTTADGIIAVSKFMSNLAELIGVKKEKIKVIYNAVDFIDWHYNNLPKQLKSEYKDKKIILTACRLTRWKGVDGIIRVLADLKELASDIMLLVIGDGPERSNLESLAKDLGVADKVKFLGSVHYDITLNYMRAADLFVLNTNYEGLSHTLLEAMTAGVPIVTTNVGGNPEVIEDGKSGLLVDYKNDAQLEAAIVKILQDNELAKRLSSEATKHLSDFSWSKTMDETVKILNGVR